jgi:YD repeat-containing protein
MSSFQVVNDHLPPASSTNVGGRTVAEAPRFSPDTVVYPASPVAQPCNCSDTGVSGFTGAQTTDASGPSIGGMDGQNPGVDLTDGSASSSFIGRASGVAGKNTVLDGVPTLVPDGEDTLFIDNAGSGMLWFDYIDSNWVERYAGTDQLTQDEPAHEYVFTSDGTQTVFNDFTVSPAALQGKVKSVTDPAGNVTTYTYDDSGNLTGTVQTTTTGTVTTKTLEQYSYLPGSDPNAGELASITSMTKTYDTSLDESDSCTPYQPIQADYYTYYTSDESGGSLGDLQTISTADAGPAAPAVALASGGTLHAEPGLQRGAGDVDGAGSFWVCKRRRPLPICRG